MIKILLVTWYRNYNYGTALQAYSLTRVLEGLCVDGREVSCQLLPHVPERETHTGQRLKKLLRPSFYGMKLQQWHDRREYEKKRELFWRREQAFDGFIRESFRFAAPEAVQDAHELARLSESFDYVVAGSDQIWNPEALDPIYLLGWALGQKFSYGSSLSVAELPKAYWSRYREALSDFKCISIRDSACRDTLSRVVGRPVRTVVDPVVLVGREALLEKAPEVVDEPHVFCYFLGRERKYRQMALSLSRSMALPIRAVIHAGSDYAADRLLEPYALWDEDPWKFVARIRDAAYVVTDSFHATVISVLCHVNFTVLPKDRSRPEQNRRILEFLQAVGLDERWGAASLGCAVTEAQWQAADGALAELRQDSLDFLKEALS